MKSNVLYFLLTLLLALRAGAAIVVTYRGDAPNMFGYGLQPTDTDFDINSDGVMDYRFTGDYFVAAIQSYGANRFISTLSVPPNLGGNVYPVGWSSVVGSDTSSLSGDWHHHTDNSPFPLLSSGFGLNSGTMPLQFADAFIGVEFNAADGIHYGWIHYVGYSHPEKGLGHYFPGGFINSWAWETQPGVPIIAGAIPEPSALILAGVAVASLSLRRRRK